MNLSHEGFLEILASLDGVNMVNVEQRTHPRVGLRSTVMIAPCVDDPFGDASFGNDRESEPGPAFSVRLQDLSEGGAAFHHFNPMIKGHRFVVDLPAGGASEPVRLLCRVQHCRMIAEHQFLIGTEFIGPWTLPAPTLDGVRAAA